MKYVTYGRSVVESKIMAKEKERRERDGKKRGKRKGGTGRRGYHIGQE